MSFQHDANDLYRHVPLEAGSFQTRFLELEKRPDDPETGIINCTLRKFSLNDAPEFEALSYYWGDKHKCKLIYVNGKEIQVTDNLENALRHLRRSTEPRLIWADALCINQNDMEERSAQVAQMHTIYQNAKRTVAWLGDGSDDGEFALQFLQWYSGRKLMLHPTDVDGKHPEYELSGWEAVRKLMQRPYWRRLWVMQEIALSKGPPTLACGRERLSWKLLVPALSDHQLNYYVTRLNRVRGAIREMETKTIKTRQQVRNGSHVIFLLSHTAAFETTEPRDRVYALYGLLRVAGIVNFVPDYSMSVAEVYQQITLFVLSMKSGLDVLELKPWDQDLALPSWVIDLSKPPCLQLPPPKVPCPWQRLTSDCDRSMEDVGRVSIRQTVPTQIIAGKAFCGAAIDEVATVDKFDVCVMNALRKVLREPDAHKYGGSSLRVPPEYNENSTYWRAIGVSSHAEGLCHHIVQYLVDWEPIITVFRNKEDSFWYPRHWDLKEMVREAPQCLVTRVNLEDDFNRRYASALKPLLCRLSLMLHGRQLFCTERGYMGAALAGVKPGDRIVAFQSTKQLHILRRLDDHQMYIGAAILTSIKDQSESSSTASEDSLNDPKSERRGHVSLRSLYNDVEEGRIPDQDFFIR